MPARANRNSTNYSFWCNSIFQQSCVEKSSGIANQIVPVFASIQQNEPMGAIANYSMFYIEKRVVYRADRVRDFRVFKWQASCKAVGCGVDCIKSLCKNRPLQQVKNIQQAFGRNEHEGGICRRWRNGPCL